MKLPDEFWEANKYGVKGGVEAAFMSTTLEVAVAMGYAAGDGSKMGIVLEIRQGMVNRGADISWLSQCACRCPSCTSARPATHATPPHDHRYPHERETLFGPLTGIEVL